MISSPYSIWEEEIADGSGNSGRREQKEKIECKKLKESCNYETAK